MDPPWLAGPEPAVALDVVPRVHPISGRVVMFSYFFGGTCHLRQVHLPIRRKCCFCGMWFFISSNGLRWINIFNSLPEETQHAHTTQILPVPMCSSKAKSVELFLLTLSINMPLLTPPPCQIHPRHRQLECRCSPLEQPPQRRVSGGDGRLPVRHRRTRRHRRRQHRGEVRGGSWKKVFMVLFF